MHLGLNRNSGLKYELRTKYEYRTKILIENGNTSLGLKFEFRSTLTSL